MINLIFNVSCQFHGDGQIGEINTFWGVHVVGGENSEKIGHLEDYQVIHKVEVNDRFTKKK